MEDKNTYLSYAKSKFYSDKTPNWDLSIENFICDEYVRFSPNVYGNHICEKIRRELNRRFYFDENKEYIEKRYSFTNVKASEERGDLQHNEVYYEVKVSFSSDKGKFNLRHLRPWQDIHCYLLCLVDCENNFKPNFYVINSQDIRYFNIGYMNGTRSANKNNEKAELATTLDLTDIEYGLPEMNLLDGTSFDDLYDYMCNVYSANIKSMLYELYDSEDMNLYLTSSKYSIDVEKIRYIYSGELYQKKFDEVVQEKYDKLKVA